MRRTLILSMSAIVAASGGAVVTLTSAAAAPRARLTISADPNPAKAGETVTVDGRLSGSKAVAAPVALWQLLPSGRRFHRVARTTTDLAGHYQFLQPVRTNRFWFVTARGRRSRTVFERVHALVSLSSSETLAAPGDRVSFRGDVFPSHARERIAFQERIRHRWRTVATPRLNRRSTFSLRRTFRRSGTSSFRAVLPADARNIRSYSPSVVVNVSPIHRIRHVVIIMQENRSFDQYFGTFPGAVGIPGLAGNPGPVPCLPDPIHGGCVPPFHDTSDKNYGGPHSAANAVADMDCANPVTRTGCKMDRFVAQAEKGQKCTTDDPSCSPCQADATSRCVDVMGYHDDADIPNYWTYAKDFVLQDHMYEPNASWSLPQHLFQVSEWSALCTNPHDPFSCTNALESPTRPNGSLLYAWTDMTYLLHRFGVSWGYYVFKGTEPDCEDDAAMSCAPVKQSPATPGIWNPLPSFTDVAQDGQLGNVQSLSNFFAAAKAGTLPAVSWIDPNGKVSEHPPALVSAGQTYVTGLVNAIMRSPEWNSTAIFLSWDDWGGFYDQVVTPAIDENGYGLRVPGIVISPYAKRGYIDPQTLSHDAYNKFIEDDFLGGQRLNPATDGRPDPRPDVRESNPALGDLRSDFDFGQSPRPPLILPVCPATDLTPKPKC